jgi:hypothetical protein
MHANRTSMWWEVRGRRQCNGGRFLELVNISEIVYVGGVVENRIRSADLPVEWEARI